MFSQTLQQSRSFGGQNFKFPNASGDATASSASSVSQFEGENDDDDLYN